MVLLQLFSGFANSGLSVKPFWFFSFSSASCRSRRTITSCSCACSSSESDILANGQNSNAKIFYFINTLATFLQHKSSLYALRNYYINMMINRGHYCRYLAAAYPNTNPSTQAQAFHKGATRIIDTRHCHHNEIFLYPSRNLSGIVLMK